MASSSSSGYRPSIGLPAAVPAAALQPNPDDDWNQISNRQTGTAGVAKGSRQGDSYAARQTIGEDSEKTAQDGRGHHDGQHSRGRMTFLSWVAIFPLVYGYGWVVNALVPAGTPTVFRVLAVTALVLPTMSYLVGPLLTRAFRDWLYKA